MKDGVVDLTFSAVMLDLPGAQQWVSTPELVRRWLFTTDELAATRWFTVTRGDGAFRLIHSYGTARGDRGVFVTAQDHAEGATDAALSEAREWYRRTHIPDLLGVRGVTGCSWFETDSGRTIRVYWLDEDPVAFHDDLAAKTPAMAMMDLGAAYRTLLVGAFRAPS